MKMKILTVVILFWCCIQIFPVCAEPTVLTNVELTGDIATQIAQQCMETFPLQSGDTITVIIFPTSNPLHEQFTERILLTFIEQGLIILQGDSIHSMRQLKIMPASRLGVFYTERFKQGFWGRHFIKREAFADMNIRYQDDPIQPLLSQKFSQTVEDIIPEKMIMFAEQNGLFTGIVTYKKKKTLSWLEPLTAVLITGFISFLFYTIRSE